MRANELRIGNIIDDGNGNPLIVTAINDVLVVCDNWACEHYELRHFILTHDFLDKCKEFKTKITDKYIVKYQGLKYGVYIEDSRFYFYKFNGFGIDTLCQITYLHQLQNLYFALTGKELEIKL